MLSIVERHFLSFLQEFSKRGPHFKKTLHASAHPCCRPSVIRIGVSEPQMESEQDTTQERWQSWERWSGRQQGGKGGSRERGMMSLWVILLTGDHAALIVVIGFPWEQERPGTSAGVFIEFYFKGQQLACALRIDWLVIWSVGVRVFMFILCSQLKQNPANGKNEIWLFGPSIDRSRLCVAGTDVTTLLGPSNERS